MSGIQHQQSSVSPIAATSVEVIINEHSGSNDNPQISALLEAAFSEANFDARINLARSGKEIEQLALRAAKGNSDIVVVGGGDGTINTVANALIGTNKALGVLPLGTLNHFAKDLGIPLDLPDAIRTIIEGRIKQIDTGKVNGYCFINNSSLGLYPRIVSEREKRQRLGYGKWPAFVWAAITVLRRYPFLAVKLIVDGEEIVTRAPFVFIGNNEYEMEGFHIGARKRLDSGRLSLYMTHRIGRVGLVKLALRALLGGLRNEKDFIVASAHEIFVSTRKQGLRVALDGEVKRLPPKLHYEVNPRSLNVIVPAQEDETQ